MRRALTAFYGACGWAGASFIMAICVVVLAQVGFNAADKIAAATGLPRLGLSVPSYADFTGFFLAAASFLALASTLRSGAHIRVTLLTSRLGPTTGRWAELGALALALAVAAWFAWFTARLVIESWRYGDLSPGIVAVPLWLPQSAMLVGLVALSVALLDEFVAVAQGRSPSYAGKDEGMLADARRIGQGEL